jgi:AcrR family transcriptional regulator
VAAKTPSSLRERQKLARKGKLETAALTLFRAKGFANTTVEEITHKAKVAKGTFFNYFPTKESVLLAMGERQMERLREAIAPDLADPGLDCRTRLSRLFETLAHGLEAEEDPELVRLTVFEAMKHPETLGQDANRLRLRELLGSIVELGQTAGEVRSDLDADLIAQSLEGCYFQQLFQWCADPDRFELADRLRTVIEIVLSGARASR